MFKSISIFVYSITNKLIIRLSNYFINCIVYSIIFYEYKAREANFYIPSNVS